MHLILLSGGSGKRLWPLSNGVRSKQFLKLLRADDGTMESMVQRICRQLNGDGRATWDSLTVIAGAAQKDQLLMQLPKDIGIIIEPERRDTFPAISYAISQLYSTNVIADNDIVAVMPVDPFVDSQFFEVVAQIENEILKTDADIILIGNRPYEATEKFGYIITDHIKEGESSNLSLLVKGFKEKPPILEAQSLIDDGALWNCGVFGMRVSYVLDFLEREHGIKKFDSVYMSNAFSTLPKISFDYEVVENAKNIRVIEYAGRWKDLGTWESLTQEMSEHSIGNVISDDSCSHTHILNELEVPLAVIGANEMVVVASNDGILVSSKKETYRLKEVLIEADDRPMHEKKRWGEYLVLSRSFSEEGDTITKKLVIRAGQQISYQVHNHRKEIWTIIHGDGVLYLDGHKRSISCGEVVVIEVGCKHGIYATTELEIIEIQFGTPLIEEDIARLEMEWDPDPNGQVQYDKDNAVNDTEGEKA